MTAPKPLTPFQQTLPDALPRHLRRRVERTNGGCWYVADQHQHGYARVSINDHTRLAHRVSYELLVGPIPTGLQIDHMCHTDNCLAGASCIHRGCINPAHLKAVTPRENALRSSSFVASQSRQLECKKGHSLVDGNLYLRPDGKGRQCRECQAGHSANYKAKRRGEGR